MIKLFHINDHVIDTSKFDNLIFDKTVTDFENAFAKYVGAKYAVAVNSCTNGIFLALKSLKEKVTCTIPSLVTTRFLNAVEMAGCDYKFTDNVKWVGDSYILSNRFRLGYLQPDYGCTIQDSAQKVEPCTCNDYHTKRLTIYSFYPTKPVGGICGGVAVSNDKERIDWIRQAAHFGEKLSDNNNSWESKTGFKGYQMFMGTIPAYVAFENLKRYPMKRYIFDIVRKRYNDELNNIVTNNSYHLYRIRTLDNEEFVKKAYREGIVCGIHYKPAHMNALYGNGKNLPNSEKDGREVVSIPFHEKLTNSEIDKVIKFCNEQSRYNQ